MGVLGGPDGVANEPPCDCTIMISIGIIRTQTNSFGEIHHGCGKIVEPQVGVATCVVGGGKLWINGNSPVKNPYGLFEFVKAVLLPAQSVIATCIRVGRVSFRGH